MRTAKMLSTIVFATVLLKTSAQDSFLEDIELESLKGACLTKCCQTLKSRAAMTYTYYQNSGHFIGGSGEWRINTHGYSGGGAGFMNPAK